MTVFALTQFPEAFAKLREFCESSELPKVDENVNDQEALALFVYGLCRIGSRSILGMDLEFDPPSPVTPEELQMMARHLSLLQEEALLIKVEDEEEGDQLIRLISDPVKLAFYEEAFKKLPPKDDN